jgi:hypothetical protein
MDIFTNSVKSNQCLNPGKYFYFIFPLEKMGYLENFDTSPLGFNRKSYNKIEKEKRKKKNEN